MTMPRKGSRPLTVDSASYRFMVRDDGRRATVTIEDEAAPGHVLIADFDLRRCTGVGTAEAAAFVRYARYAGWNPRAMGTFAMTDTAVDEALNAISR